MIKTTGHMVLVAGRTVMAAGTWADPQVVTAPLGNGFFGAESSEFQLPLRGFLVDTGAIRPGLAVAVEHLQHLRPGPPASTRPPAPTARVELEA